MKISVVIRTKNSGKTLAQCLESLKNQTDQVEETIVVDSGSTDNTLEIASVYRCKVIHYPSYINFNYSRSLNLGIESATGEYILIVSSHVCLKYPNTIELMRSFLSSWELISAVSTVRDEVPDISTVPDHKDANWKIVTRHNFQGQGMYNFCSLIRKADWKQYNFNENIPRCEDQDWILHFYKENNAGSVIISYPTVYYNNPYYNARKDAWDYIVLGHYNIDGYFISKNFIYKILGESVQYLLKMNLNKAFHNITVVYYIVLYRLKGLTIQSTYNAKFEKGSRIS